MKAILIVRAEVNLGKRDQFDRWYEDEHLPEALIAFGAERAERGWDVSDPNVHVAIYYFHDAMEAQKKVTAALPILVAEFDRHWDGYVKRARTFITQSQEIVGSQQN